jgi:hypothetical protein
MANRILLSVNWEGRVRGKLGVTSADLPDADIDQPEVITVSEAKVIRAVPGYAALTDDDLVFLEAVVVVTCALQVIESMPTRLPTRVKGPSMEIEVTVDWQKRRHDLEGERDTLLGYIEGEDKGIGTFALAGPQR